MSDIIEKKNMRPSGRQIAARCNVAYSGSIKNTSLYMRVESRQIMNMAPSLKKFTATKKTVFLSYRVSEFTNQLNRFLFTA